MAGPQEFAAGSALVDAERMQEQLRALENERDDAVRELELWRQRIAALKQEHQRAKNQVASLRERLRTLESELDSNAAGGASQELAELRERLAQAEGQRGPTDRELVVLRERTKVLLEGLEAEKHTVEGLRAQLADRGDGGNDLQWARQRIEALKSERHEVKEKLNHLRLRLRELEEQVDDAGDVHFLRQRVEALKNERHEVKEKLNHLRVQMRELEAAAAQAKDIGLLRQRIEALKSERRADKEKLNKLRVKLRELEEKGEAPANSDSDGDLPRSPDIDPGQESAEIAALRLRIGELEADRQRLLGALYSDKPAAQPSLRDRLIEEKRRSKKLLTELTRLRNRLGDIEAERRLLAAELQRTTDALHEHQLASESPDPPPIPRTQRAAPRPPLVAARKPGTPQAQQPAQAKTKAAGVQEKANASEDSLAGRPVDKLLADIDDLIANSVPRR